MSLRYFKDSEFADIDKMNPDFLKKLDSYRTVMETPIVITSSTDGVHSDNSQHYKGRATDIILPNTPLSLFDCFVMAVRTGFTGIGIYPDWYYGDEKKGGLHVDYRLGQHAFWIGAQVDSKQKYFTFNLQNLKRFNII